jgi:nucleotidyltransferase substrate binding protein (TIGR01987 family)
MSLPTNKLKNALTALSESIFVANAYAKSENEELKETIRAGVIQNFETAYEQCWKYMQRWLRENQSPEAADFPRTRKDLFRSAAQFGLVEDPVPWFEYSDARNMTSHLYDEDSALYVYQVAEKFVIDANSFLKKLEQIQKHE